jgi:uncharacterized protein with PIN domain
MRFLVDECTGPSVAEWLRNQKHEVFSVFEEARGMDDDDIILKALEENWILVTNDKDFIRTLQNWEQGRRKPEGPAKALLRIASKNPGAVLDALHAE